MVRANPPQRELGDTHGTLDLEANVVDRGIPQCHVLASAMRCAVEEPRGDARGRRTSAAGHGPHDCGGLATRRLPQREPLWDVLLLSVSASNDLSGGRVLRRPASAERLPTLRTQAASPIFSASTLGGRVRKVWPTLVEDRCRTTPGNGAAERFGFRWNATNAANAEVIPILRVAQNDVLQRHGGFRHTAV